MRSAPWPSGKAEDCKSFIPGSNPGGASRFLGESRLVLCRKCAVTRRNPNLPRAHLAADCGDVTDAFPVSPTPCRCASFPTPSARAAASAMASRRYMAPLVGGGGIPPFGDRQARTTEGGAPRLPTSTGAWEASFLRKQAREYLARAQAPNPRSPITASGLQTRSRWLE